LPHDRKPAEFYNAGPKNRGFGLKFGANPGSILTKLFSVDRPMPRGRGDNVGTTFGRPVKFGRTKKRSKLCAISHNLDFVREYLRNGWTSRKPEKYNIYMSALTGVAPSNFYTRVTDSPTVARAHPNWDGVPKN